MAARKCREIHDVEQVQKMVPFITRETTLGQHVYHLVFGVSIFDWDLGVYIYSDEQPIQRNSVCPGNMSHRWTSPFDDNFDNCLVILKDVQLRFTMRRICVHRNLIYIRQINVFGRLLFGFG